MSKRTIIWIAMAVVATGVTLGVIYVRKVFDDIKGLENIGSPESFDFMDEYEGN